MKGTERGYPCPSVRVLQRRHHDCFCWLRSSRSFLFPGLSKAESQALTNYGSGEDEEEVEVEEFEAAPVDVQTSLQASADLQPEQEVSGQAAGQETGEEKSEQRSSERDGECSPFKIQSSSSPLRPFFLFVRNQRVCGDDGGHGGGV